ncbi:MAG TPA: hypothetical protein VK918_00575 [Pyrinomonadaceae bacterium]|nr:hypothetical protein [Pyrinomonadaceae bacterium]
MTRVLFVIIGALVFSTSAAAQNTVTNADLEKYRQKRVAAEKDLRENYERLGFPSPEELEAKRIEDAKEREELAARLAQARIERERVAAEIRANEASRQGLVIINEQIDYGRTGVYGYAYPVPYRNIWRGGRYFPRRPIIGWRAGPGGLIYEPGGRSSQVWSPSIVRPRPVFRQR